MLQKSPTAPRREDPWIPMALRGLFGFYGPVGNIDPSSIVTSVTSDDSADHSPYRSSRSPESRLPDRHIIRQFGAMLTIYLRGNFNTTANSLVSFVRANRAPPPSTPSRYTYPAYFTGPSKQWGISLPDGVMRESIGRRSPFPPLGFRELRA